MPPCCGSYCNSYGRPSWHGGAPRLHHWLLQLPRQYDIAMIFETQGDPARETQHDQSDYYRQGARSNIAQISLRQMKYALSWKSFARSIQSCQRHILLGARVIKGIFCHVQGLFNIVKGVLSLNRNRDIDHRNDTITYNR